MPKKIVKKSKKVEAPSTPKEEVETKKPENQKEVPTKAQVIKQLASDKLAMKEELRSQPKVKFMIPLNHGEGKGATDQVCINGCKLVYPKGVMIDMPEQVAQMFSDKYQVEMQVRSQSLEGKEDTVKEGVKTGFALDL
jgi:hypothetical protein